MLRVQTIGILTASRSVRPVAINSQAPTARVILGSAKRIDLILNESFRLINNSVYNYTLGHRAVGVTDSKRHFRVFINSNFLIIQTGTCFILHHCLSDADRAAIHNGTCTFGVLLAISLVADSLIP